MDISAQIIVTGFHRSGTSMAMQSLKKAGLHIGDSLLGAAPSNPDGHFEDIEAVNLHDAWLNDAGTDWCCTKQPPAIPTADAKHGIQPIIDRLSRSHLQWGMKDPRAALYLNEWFSQLSNPYAVLVYRHFASCANSLKKRQAGTLLLQPSNEADRVRFWTNPTVALASWLVHNQAVLQHIKKYPERCVLISQESQIAGANLPALVQKKFLVDIEVHSDTGVDKTKTTLDKTIKLDAKTLQQKLEATWHELQSLSISPAKHYPSVVWGSNEDNAQDNAKDNAKDNANNKTRVEDVNTALQHLQASWDSLGVSVAR